jgi:chromosome partitioning protein
MRYIVWTEKGGAGKTTTAVAFAAAAARRRGALIVDLDPQADVTNWLLGERPSDRTMVDVLAGRCSMVDAARAVPGVANLSIVPGARRLTSIESELSDSPVPQLALKKALDVLDDGVDVIIDAPPAYGLLSVSGLIAAERHILPVRPSALDTSAVSETLRLVDEVRQSINPGLVLSAFVLTAFDARETFGKTLFDGLRAANPETPVVKIPAAAPVKMAPAVQQTLEQYAPLSPATLAYRGLTDQLMGVMVS